MFEEWVNSDLHSLHCAFSIHTHAPPSGGIFAYRLLRADYSSNQNCHNQGDN